MIYIALPFPVIPRSHLKEISKKLKEPYDELERVQGYAKYLDLRNQSNVRYLAEADVQEQEDFHPGVGDMGSTALLKLLKQRGIEQKTVNCIYLTGYIWQQLKSRERKGLTYLLMRVENRVRRFNMLVDLGAPELIIRNEARMIEESVSMLEDNSGNCGYRIATDSDEKPYVSLKDINFNLLDLTWIDPDPPEDEDPQMELDPPKYYTEHQLKDLNKELGVLHLREEGYKKKISTLEGNVRDLESQLRELKDKYRRLQEERDKKVMELSKENRRLDHRIDEIIAAQKGQFLEVEVTT